MTRALSKMTKVLSRVRNRKLPQTRRPHWVASKTRAEEAPSPRLAGLPACSKRPPLPVQVEQFFFATHYIPFAAPNFSGQSSSKTKTSKAAGSSSGGSAAKPEKSSEAKAKAAPPAVAKTQVPPGATWCQLVPPGANHQYFPCQVVEVFEYDPLLGYCTVKRKTVPILEVSEHGSTPPPSTTASVNLNFLQVDHVSLCPIFTTICFRLLLHHLLKRKKPSLRRRKNRKV